jgi:hypothetical protein
MNRHRGIVTNGIKFNSTTIKVRRSIDLRELANFGSITETSVDLPTSGATHRKATKGSTSGTRGYVNLSTITDGTIVDRQDMGSITDVIRDTLGYNNEPYLH